MSEELKIPHSFILKEKNAIMRMITLILAMTLVLVATVQAITDMPTTPAKIDVSASALTKQDDNYSAVITAVVTDSQGKPSQMANVIFNASKGNLTTAYGFNNDSQGWLNQTDSNGKASAVLALAAPESITVTVRVGSITATVTVSPQPSTISVTAQPTTVVTAPPLPTPTAATPTKTAVATPVVTTPGVTATTPAATIPKATTSPAAGATTPSTPGFGVVISLLTILALKFIRRK